MKQAVRFRESRSSGWYWQHSESPDVLHLLLCTVNTTAVLAGCDLSSAQCQRLRALFNDAVIFAKVLWCWWRLSVEQWGNDADSGKLK